MAVQDGNTIKIHYLVTLPDGTKIDESTEDAPLEFTLGQQMLIPGVESACIGMELGEKKSAIIPPEEAYGDYREDLSLEVERNQFPEDTEIEVGAMFQVGKHDGSVMNVTVTKVEDDKITIDANHPLAGQTLVFDIEIAEICG